MKQKKGLSFKKNGLAGKNLLLPRIEDYSSRPEWENACWKKLLSRKDLLQLFTTAHERHSLVLRVAALELLTMGKSYRDIGKELWLSPQTISGIKKSFHENNYRSYKTRSKKERKNKTYSNAVLPAKRSGHPHRTKYGTTIHLPY